MMKTQVQERFSEFFEKWLLQIESNIQQLLSVHRDPSHEPEHRSLICKIMNHYKEYYSTKWACVHDDILGFFSPPWLTPLENAYLWMTGWKPSMLYRLVHSLRHAKVPGTSLSNLSEDQLKKIEELRLRTSMEEEKVEREMERQQVSMADRKMVELARLATRVRNGEIVREVDGLVEVALKVLLGGLEKLLKTADCVRLKALKGVLEVLSPLQCVDFMAAFFMVQFQMRRLGKTRIRNGDLS
ncbi:Transcription factor TGA like domain [Macleaya cordata]|uniref:Transcription factor TGA like domain n=1 Tax=Macleaya cordata TaxID=56857 RepID=A0A200Q9W5_MACCD|nr:Transcription factor TGA like domain [Macleaya cordata]